MKLNYDTKEFQIDRLSKLKIMPSKYNGQISATRENYHNNNNFIKNFLLNIYEGNNCLIRNIFLIQFQNELSVIDGLNYIEILNDFINDKVKLMGIIGNKDKKNPLFSELKSSQRRLFINFYFRTIVIQAKNEQDINHILIHLEKAF